MAQLTLQDIHKERNVLLNTIKSLITEFEQLTHVLVTDISVTHTPMFAGQCEDYIGSVISDIHAHINYEEYPVKQ